MVSLSTTSTRKLSGLMSGVMAVAVSAIWDPFIRLSTVLSAGKLLRAQGSDTVGAKILGLDCNRAENILVQDSWSDVAMARVQILFAARPGRSGHCDKSQSSICTASRPAPLIVHCFLICKCERPRRSRITDQEDKRVEQDVRQRLSERTALCSATLGCFAGDQQGRGSKIPQGLGSKTATESPISFFRAAVCT